MGIYRTATAAFLSLAEVSGRRGDLKSEAIFTDLAHRANLMSKHGARVKFPWGSAGKIMDIPDAILEQAFSDLDMSQLVEVRQMTEGASRYGKLIFDRDPEINKNQARRIISLIDEVMERKRQEKPL